MARRPRDDREGREPPRGFSEAPAGIRAFFAVPLDDRLGSAVADLADRLRQRPGGEQVRWVPRENLHVTLHFLGDVSSDAISDLLERVATRTATIEPFAVRLGAPRLFPTAKRPRVVALSLEPQAPIRRLAAAVEGGVVAAGFPAEERRFRAHLSVGRIAARAPRPDVTAPDTPPSDALLVTEAVLFRSELLPSGARYTPLSAVPLGTARDPHHP